MTRNAAIPVLAELFTNHVDKKFKPGDGDRDPIYTFLPSGGRANRVRFAGVLTDVEQTGDDGSDQLRGRITGATGNVFVYAGEYQPEARASLANMDAPEHVMVVGKVKTFSPDDSDDVYVSIRPENIATVDESDWAHHLVQAAEGVQTRLESLNEEAPDEVDMGFLASDDYGDDTPAEFASTIGAPVTDEKMAEYREAAIEAVEKAEEMAADAMEANAEAEAEAEKEPAAA